MNEQARILFNISFSLSGDNTGEIQHSPRHFYVQRSIITALTRSLYRREGIEGLGRQLAAVAHQAYFARQTEVMQKASQLILALPLSKELKSAALYYQALCTWKQGSADEAQRALSRVIDTASPPYQARGLLSAGGIHFVQGEYEAALPNYLAAAKAARKEDVQTFVIAQRMIAVMRSICGDHQRALIDLENLFPLGRAIAKYYPTCYYDFLNSYAIELGEVGRIAEAQNVCAVTLASPFAAAYPEYQQTRDELAAKRTAATPSVIAVPAAASDILAAPQAQVESEATPARARSTISLKLRRYCSLSCLLLIVPAGTITAFVSTQPFLDWLVDSSLPRGPPALS